MAVPPEILDLVERFHRQVDAYHSGSYNETQTRREFIDPFFKALGWDVDNTSGTPEAYKDVIHEDAIKIGGITKAPDYCFRTSGVRRFFVEAKKPSVNILHDANPAFQLRRYGWSAKLSVSILTDFEDFIVYDCRVAPIKTDTPDLSRILVFHFTEYAEKWEEIESLFSKKAVLEGSLDMYAEKLKTQKGIATVDDAFLREIEDWREKLARNIAVWNPSLSQRDLNFVVQITIDRIVFLRICEDRNIETSARILALTNGSQIYPRLVRLFHEADDRYNSGLFYFKKELGREEIPDELTPSLYIEDDLLKNIIKRLYYPDSPYEFSVIPVEILGQVYERFLGKIIRVDANRNVIIDIKPEIRKAGGVYYTPSHIVNLIVSETVGRLVANKTPQQLRGINAEKKASRGKKSLKSKRNTSFLTIIDPACGSGSFLLAAYQYLLDWYRDWYVNDGTEKHLDRVYQVQGAGWSLTTTERKSILLNHIYGVDIDPQAVEVTKLSLLLKVLEGETDESVTRQLRLFNERALPDLSANIKCGNSLIAADFYDIVQAGFINQETQYRINVFDWDVSFAHIMQSGGFDAVIGNPPWISLTGKFGNDIYTDEEVAYLTNKFKGNTYMPNIYEYFVAQGLGLVKSDGYYSFIVPDRLGYNAQFIALRERILKKGSVLSLIYKAPFPGIVADTLIFVICKVLPNPDHTVSVAEYGRQAIQRKQSDFLSDPKHVFEYFENNQLMGIIEKIAALSHIAPLSHFCESTSGFGGKSQLIQSEKSSPTQIQVYKGDSIGRYELRKEYWFDFKKSNITGRTTDKAKLGASPKILLRKTGNAIIATHDETTTFPEQSLYFLFQQKTDASLKYILGILNSKLLNAYYQARSLTNKKSIAQVKKVDLDLLPIPMVSFSNLLEKEGHDQIVEAVEQILNLQKQLQIVKTNQDRVVIQRQIDGLEKKIDRLVYKIYQLEESEIKIIETITTR